MKVFYQRTYSIAPYLTERIGFEVDTEIDSLMPDGKKIDPTTAVQSLKELCDKAHKELNPNLEEMKGTHVVPVQEKETKIGMIEAINDCTTLDVLKTFSLLSKSNPENKAAYDKKYLELSK